MEPNKILGQYLQKWREAARLTQAQVSEKTGIVQHQISRLEHGARERPSFQDVVKIVAVYGVTPNEAAQVAYGWIPPARYQSEDYRWRFVQDFLTKANEAQKERFLQEMYDRAVFFKELGEEYAAHPE